MAERIGLSKPLRPDWLNDVALYAVQGLSRKEAGEELNKTLGQCIGSADTLRKTRSILLDVWYKVAPQMLDEAKAIYKVVSSDERPAIHYALLADQYKIFYDMADVLGHLMEYREIVSSALIKEKMYEKWGARASLDPALSKNLKTFREMQWLCCPGKKTEYACVEHSITDIHVLGLLLHALLKNSSQDYISWDAFVSSPFMFPFAVKNADESHMAALPYVELHRFDNKTMMSVKIE